MTRRFACSSTGRPPTGWTSRSTTPVAPTARYLGILWSRTPTAASASTPSPPARSTPAASPPQPDELKQQIGSYSSLGNRGSPHDVAAAVTWPASSTASYTTGAVLIVDGGKGARRLSRLSADPDTTTPPTSSLVNGEHHDEQARLHSRSRHDDPTPRTHATAHQQHQNGRHPACVRPVRGPVEPMARPAQHSRPADQSRRGLLRIRRAEVLPRRESSRRHGARNGTGLDLRDHPRRARPGSHRRTGNLHRADPADWSVAA